MTDFNVTIDNDNRVQFSCAGCVPEVMKPHIQMNEDGTATATLEETSRYFLSIGRGRLRSPRTPLDITEFFVEGSERDCGCANKGHYVEPQEEDLAVLEETFGEIGEYIDQEPDSEVVPKSQYFEST